MAPEIYNARYNEKVDVWSAGIILYEIVIKISSYPKISGEVPFYGQYDWDIQKKVKENDVNFNR